MRVPDRQLVTAMFSSASLAVPWRVNEAPEVPVHSTVWSEPAFAVGGWFTIRPDRATSTVMLAST